ncbi:MAG: exo-beta-N-acetylmuramidase NamZ family protein [Bdellovibrionales bacterium]
MILGSEVFLKNPKWIQKIKSKKVAYVGHAASVTQKGELVLPLLLNHPDLLISSVFSPQHGFGGVQQANMITSEDTRWKELPLFSLYSQKTRRLTKAMKDSFDVLLFDLQDVGCRIYTYLTTLFYLIEDCENEKTIYILDRPNPLGRYVEGNCLDLNFKSFVGEAALPMSHGLTLGEAALWFKHHRNLKTDLQVIPMRSYSPKHPLKNKVWVDPSPNMTSLSCAKCYPGTVLLEGTTLSEGRGTTKPLEVFGHPNMNVKKIKSFIKEYGKAWFKGCFLREKEFEPQFDKFKNKTCYGFQIHLDSSWSSKGEFRPYRLMNLLLKAFRHTHPEIPWKLNPPYEYEFKKWPIDIISGDETLKNWIESSQTSFKEREEYLLHEEQKWKKQRKDFLIY